MTDDKELLRRAAKDDKEAIQIAAVDMTREIVTKAMADKDARIAELEAALRPFVRRQILKAWAGHQGDAVFKLNTTLHDLRRAAAALGGEHD